MRRGFLLEVGFKVHRGFETEGALELIAVVKHFDPFKDGRPGFGASGKLTTMPQFPFVAAPQTGCPSGYQAGSCWECCPPGPVVADERGGQIARLDLPREHHDHQFAELDAHN